MKVYIGADHRGYQLAESLTQSLKQQGVDVEHLGKELHTDSDDYVDFAKMVGEKVAADDEAKGVAICGSGVGVDIAANKVKGVRSVLGYSPEQVTSARRDDNVNVLSIGSDFTPSEKAESLVNVFLQTPFENTERFQRRLEKLQQLEQ